MKKTLILLVEDERDLALIIRDTLSTLDYRVLPAADGEEGLRLYREHRPDIVVTDVMMPRMDGFTFVRRLRATDKRTPIIFLTARTDTDDVVSGFKMGADDYLRKPFSMRELIARIESILSRFDHKETMRPISEDSLYDDHQKVHADACTTKPSQAAAEENPPSTDANIVCLGGFELHADACRLSFEGNAPIALTHRESEILLRLFRAPGRVVASRALLLNLWGSDTPCNARSLHVFISKLRSKLSVDPSLRILNVHGVGYKLCVER